MPVALTVNGVTFNYPVSGDENWAEQATNWAVAVTQNLATLNTAVGSISTGVFVLADGTVGAPSLRFLNSPTTGLYRVSPNVLGFTVNGANVGQINADGGWEFGPVAGGVDHLFRGNLEITEDFEIGGDFILGGDVDIAGNVDIDGDVDIAGGLITQASLILHTRTLAAGSDTMTADDAILYVNFAGSVAITLPEQITAGRFLIIKDISGAAATNNITITPDSGLIDGAANAVINTNYGSFILLGDGTNWEAIGNSGASSGAVMTVNGTTVLGSTANIVLVNQSALATITLPAASAGKIVEIKDFSGNAEQYNIIVAGSGGAEIDQEATVTINMNYQSLRLVSNGTNWSLI